MKYFLLDASALVAYYAKDEPGPVKGRVRYLFAAQADEQAFLYVPNFCVAEILGAFAKKCWGEEKFGSGVEADNAFEEYKKAILDDIIDSKILYSYELSRRHIKGCDKIYRLARTISFRKGDSPSAFDILVVSMAFDLCRIHGDDNFRLIAAERPIHDICSAGRAAGFPKSICIKEGDVPKSFLK